MKHKAIMKFRLQPTRSCKAIHALSVKHTPPLSCLPPELRDMIYELVGHSTLNEARTLGFKTPSKSFALLRARQQLRLEAKSSWSQVLDAEVNRSSEETQQVQAICDIVRKWLVARLRNDPNVLHDRVSLRLYYLRKAFLMAMEEMEQWKGGLQMLCIEMYKMRTEWP
ncbi:hypothetical protein B0A48_14937 [Cryoendolithus antarcticus]|uniref:Uncharacterized protein n=1 Tax=Cryoendolithus antarcticus TaxID=1507870 RepID=A0A1V8SIV9_9PEZI|nr:hypothetical protein B0A48_14937 [Cryoendolithus antarcticus]